MHMRVLNNIKSIALAGLLAFSGFFAMSETCLMAVNRYRLKHLIREGSRHSWWGNPASGRRSAVPRHSEVPDPLARKTCRDLGIFEP